jgi:hypothetical protein
VFREVPLLKVGVIMMALALVIAAVVSVALSGEPERLVAAEVATESPGEAPRNSSGDEGSATNKSSSQKESSRYPSEESLGYGSSSSGGSVGQRKEDAKEPQLVVQQEAQAPNSQSEMPQPASQQTPSEVPSELQPQPQEQPLPAAERSGWPEPSQGELESANQERRYELLPGAIMGLTP